MLRADRSRPFLLSPLLAMSLLPAVAWAGSWPDLPLPSGTDTTEVARRIVFNGLDMRAETFGSRQSAAEVVAFYRAAWGDRAVVNKLGSSQVIGYREGDYFITVQVSGFGNGSKGRIGMIDVAGAPRGFVAGKGVPRPMGAEVFNDIAYPDDPVPARTVAMRDALSPRQNAAFFRERLAGDGWKPEGDGRCADDDTCLLSFARGDSKLALVAVRRGSGQSQVVVNIQNPQEASP